MKKAVITDIIGQDGSYLAELLLSKGYELLGLASPGKGRKIVEQCFDGWHHWHNQVSAMER